MKEQELRNQLGSFGIKGAIATQPLPSLSGVRLCSCLLGEQGPLQVPGRGRRHSLPRNLSLTLAVCTHSLTRCSSPFALIALLAWQGGKFLTVSPFQRLLPAFVRSLPPGRALTPSIPLCPQAARRCGWRWQPYSAPTQSTSPTAALHPVPLPYSAGGQAVRVALAAMFYSAPNLLVLDEPSNHLDLEGVECLAVALQEYGGAVLLVSHDQVRSDSQFSVG